ncbi:MAG: hypothetical protein AB7P40_25185 [Chloroflexota bacterium]
MANRVNPAGKDSDVLATVTANLRGNRKPDDHTCEYDGERGREGTAQWTRTLVAAMSF